MVEKCHNCGCKIHGFLTGRKYVGEDVHCRDCYYEELGEFIEQNPIGAPHNKIRPDKRHQP